jgi:hypothetical protein
MKKTLNAEGITNELKGASLYFPGAPKQQSSLPRPTPIVSRPEEPSAHQATQQPTKQLINQSSNIASNITILQLLDDTDIANLREPAYQAQTFRLTQQEIEWVKDTAYRLSKEMKRKKVAQADILRISFKLFERLLATHKAELLTILERIK